MNWTDTHYPKGHEREGEPRDPVERWREREKAPDVPRQKYEDAEAYLGRMEQADEDLTADLAALCEEVSRMARSFGESNEEVRAYAMRHARNPDGTPRWPRREGCTSIADRHKPL